MLILIFLAPKSESRNKHKAHTQYMTMSLSMNIIHILVADVVVYNNSQYVKYLYIIYKVQIHEQQKYDSIVYYLVCDAHPTTEVC
jgi:hypothetical protein